jgi:hypothetical protein
MIRGLLRSLREQVDPKHTALLMVDPRKDSEAATARWPRSGAGHEPAPGDRAPAEPLDQEGQAGGGPGDLDA